jgi:hypothetical protein
MDISLIQQVKIQARVLVPLVKALQSELGEERANALVRRALGGNHRHRWLPRAPPAANLTRHQAAR